MSLIENPYYDAEDRIADYPDQTEYELTRFSDRIVENPLRFEIVESWDSNGRRFVQVEFSEGEVIEEGTDLSEVNLGNMDVGIAILYEWRKWVNDQMLMMALKTDGLEMTTLNGLIANAYGVTFDQIASENIEIVRGRFDGPKREVWS